MPLPGSRAIFVTQRLGDWTTAGIRFAVPEWMRRHMESKEECPCPRCNQNGRRMDMLSLLFLSDDYFHCPNCGQVWTVPKDECSPTETVTL